MLFLYYFGEAPHDMFLPFFGNLLPLFTHFRIVSLPFYGIYSVRFQSFFMHLRMKSMLMGKSFKVMDIFAPSGSFIKLQEIDFYTTVEKGNSFVRRSF